MVGIDKKDGADNQNNGEKRFREEVYSKAVRAGKRTYFFDVKMTRKDEYYLTITESKKKFDQDGKYHFEKHKIFLYKEDFDKFSDGLAEIIDYIHERQPYEPRKEEEKDVLKEYSDVEFEDLASS
ncbi:DUF3276 family protein [Prolixibacter sp. SD074]|jgi:hypothetical protein|uniref:DUF3276 family protein n=1 Tax=Prolixibacter sp. SD074 TaxID=2652391 RepID=UPI0012719906|nr:DUF3276 family protein [Prolixibacter sp. SD074]GET28428.1 DNA-binding protein [Prolixibacter sp. SD074]